MHLLFPSVSRASLSPPLLENCKLHRNLQSARTHKERRIDVDRGERGGSNFLHASSSTTRGSRAGSRVSITSSMVRHRATRNRAVRAGNLGEKAEKRSALERDIDTRFDPNRFGGWSRTRESRTQGESNRRLGTETSLSRRNEERGGKKGKKESRRNNHGKRKEGMEGAAFHSYVNWNGRRVGMKISIGSAKVSGA